MQRGPRVLDRSKVGHLRRSLAAVIALVVTSTSASAQVGWPTPVAGTSASGDPEVIFTFDDGPNPATTPAVLDTLAAHGIHAVFFETADHYRDDAARARPILARIIAAGHIVGNHTVNHPDLCKVPEERASWEIDRAHATLEAETGMPIPWMRTPYGSYCTRIVEELGERGLVNWFWDIDAQEWRTNNAKLTVARITWALAHLQGRAVVLMHDTKAATVKALPQILDWLDAENAARKAAGQRPIRVIPAYDYARELLGKDAASEAKALLADAADALAGGLASAVP